MSLCSCGSGEFRHAQHDARGIFLTFVCSKCRATEGLLVRVVAPHFVAGLVVNESGVCVAAAPILAWAIGKPRDELRDYFARKRWAASILPDRHPPARSG